jgi:phage terminase large subunit
MADFTIQKVKVSLELYRAIKAGKKGILFQGGTGAGKTFNIEKTLIGIALTKKEDLKKILSAYDYDGEPLSISVVGPSLPHMKKGVIRDWSKIMEKAKIYNPQRHHRTEQLYTYPSKSFMEFFSAENEEKVRGPGRKILYVNEINLFDYETIRQLLVRTDLFMVGDYNPIDEFHWLYDELLTRDDFHYCETTFRDNPFLPKGRRQEIERNRERDPEWYLVYGEGKRGKSEGLVYPQNVSVKMPDGQVVNAVKWDHEYQDVSDYVYAVDFAFNVESAIAKVGMQDKELHLKEQLYQRYMTNADLIQWIKNNIPDWRTARFVCDSAEPDRITEMVRAGIKAIACNKSITVQWVKSHKLHIYKHSPHTLKEIRSYKFVKNEKTNKYTDVPVKGNDHLMDCLKYGAAYFFKPKSKTKGKAYD